MLWFGCGMQQLIDKRFLLLVLLFLFIFYSWDWFYLLQSSPKSICIALTTATLQYLFGTLSFAMFRSYASWGCGHRCHFLSVFSFHLCLGAVPAVASTFTNKVNIVPSLDPAEQNRRQLRLRCLLFSICLCLSRTFLFQLLWKTPSCSILLIGQWVVHLHSKPCFLPCLCKEIGGIKENSFDPAGIKVTHNPHCSFALAAKNDRRIRRKVTYLLDQM